LSNSPNFGFVHFSDGHPTGSALISLDGDTPFVYRPGKRLSDHAILWCNLSADTIAGSELAQNENFKHAHYLSLSPEDLIAEFGVDIARVDSEAFCQKASSAFSRLMRLASFLASDIAGEPGYHRLLASGTLAEALLSIIPGLSYPDSEHEKLLSLRRRGPSFTRGRFTREPGDIFLTLRRPRATHARSLLSTEVPVAVSPENTVVRSAQRLGEILDIKGPTLGNIIIRNVAKNVAPVYGYGKFSYARQETRSHWLCQEELAAIADFVDIEALGALTIGRYGSALSLLPDKMRGFVTGILPEVSISAGIISENIWRAFFIPQKADSVFRYRRHPSESWQGMWLAANDRIISLSLARSLAEKGHRIISHGNGWVNISVSPALISEAIIDGLSIGLLPSLLDAQLAGKLELGYHEWGGEPELKAISHFVVSQNAGILWEMDKIPYAKKERAQFLSETMMHYGGIAKNAG